MVILTIAIATTAGAATTSGPAYDRALQRIGTRLDVGKRYTDACVDQSRRVVTDFPNYVGRDVVRCVYKLGDQTALAYTLHPSKTDLATWIATACAPYVRTDPKVCADRLFDRVWGQNNAQYPVAGAVIEDGSGGGCEVPTQFYRIAFRDGVAVRMMRQAKFCMGGALSIDAQDADARSSDIRYYFEARVAALQLETYERLCGVKLPRLAVSHSSKGPFPTAAWGEVSRQSYLRALDGGSYGLLNLQALAYFGPPGKSGDVADCQAP